MTIEVGKTTTPVTYPNLSTVMFDLAVFLSASVNFQIIDSYGSSAGRHKGDPISGQLTAGGNAGQKWFGGGDVGQPGWMVIEAQTSIHSGLGTTLPKWQTKLENHNTVYYYDVSDPTGVIYPNAYWYRDLRSRFCPWGGWDFADSLPDFRPVGQPYRASFDNWGIANGLGHGGSGNDIRSYMVAAPGTLIMFTRRNQNAYDFMGLGLYVGDARPIKAGNLPNPRAQLAVYNTVSYMQEVGNGYILAEESYTNSNAKLMFADASDSRYGAQPYRVPTGWTIHANGVAVPNGQSSSLEIDTYPFVPCPTDQRGVWFDFPYMRKGYGVGAALIANKTWLSTGTGYCVYLPWDGSTSLN